MIASMHKSILLLVLALVGSTNAFFQPRSSNNCSPRLETTSIDGVMDFLNEGKKNLVKSLAGDYDADAIRVRTDGLINDNPVLMLSFTTCPFCIKAKGVLDEMNAKYTVVELDADPDGKAIRAEMADLVGRTSVPAIWIGQKFVGGCNDGPMGGVVKLSDEGKLEAMLQEVGAI